MSTFSSTTPASLNSAVLSNEQWPRPVSRTSSGSRPVVEVNALGTFDVTQRFAPVLARNGGGAVANVVSIAGLANFPLFLSYSLSKAALHSLTQATRLFLGMQGTKVFGIYPGPVDTDMAEEVEFDKVSPAHVAETILAGIEAGTEEIYPDPMAEQFGAGFEASPKGLEQQVAQMVTESATA